MRALPRFGPPPDASLDGHRVDALFGRITAVTGCGLVLVVVALAWLLWRYRARPGHRAMRVRGDGRGYALAVLGVSAVVFVAVDFDLVRTARADLTRHVWATPRGPGVLRVEVMPQQFAWNVRYAGRDGRFATDDDVVTLNDLRVPRGVPVAVQLVARDVIHSFFLPHFRIKQDAVPGRVTRAWFQATADGRYEIACSQLCGFGHYQMRGTLTVLPPAEYARWSDAMTADARRAPAITAQWGWPWQD